MAYPIITVQTEIGRIRVYRYQDPFSFEDYDSVQGFT